MDSNTTAAPTLDNNLLQQILQHLQLSNPVRQDDMITNEKEGDFFTRDRRDWVPSVSFIEDYTPAPLHNVEWILPREDKSAIWDAAPKKRGIKYHAPDIPPVLYQRLSKKSKMVDKDLAKIGTKAAIITRPLDYLAYRIWQLQDKLDDDTYQELLQLSTMTRNLVSDLTSYIMQVRLEEAYRTFSPSATSLLNREDKSAGISDEKLKEDMKALQKFKEFSNGRCKTGSSNQNRQFDHTSCHTKKGVYNTYNNNDNNNNSEYNRSWARNSQDIPPSSYLIHSVSLLQI
ncbi:hypothetical protein FBU30_008215 [Linnemannia zychae]|nr:hypothetical protein FBU30_008215 [Linnemannia zychae]